MTTKDYKYNSLNNYPDYLFHNGAGEIINLKTEPTVLLIYSGKLTIECNNKKVTGGKGDCLFMKGGIIVNIIKKNCGKDRFCGVFISFSKSFLIDFYCNLNCQNKIFNSGTIQDCVVKLTLVPCIKSLYISMIPYVESNIKPSGDILELKQMEAIYCLLIIDERFYQCFFDFIFLWKFDMFNLFSFNRLSKN